MKYSDLLKFEPINEVVKFDRLEDSDYRKQLVRTFVFSQDYADHIIPFICDNLDYNNLSETFGLQIVGNYGTGKSHLMSLFTLVAEDADYLNLVTNDKAREALSQIAGKYKVLRFEMGNTQDLWDIICYQLDKFLSANGVDYSIYNDKTEDTYLVKLRKMMATFEEKYPNKGLMVVIDEMLSYLKGRSDSSAKLNMDLAVLQALGQMSDHTRFRMVFGVQEQLFENSSDFQFVVDTLNKVKDRYKTIYITKQEVKFVTEQRLLKKTKDQKDKIRTHLAQYTTLFPEMHANLEEYVDLFPVHPAFFDNFQMVKISNGQREILKTLSAKFEGLRNKEVPEDEPGLISFDSYWVDLTAPSMKANPDVKRINDIMDVIGQKISSNFTGAEASKRVLATRIANACGVRVLQGSLAHPTGITAQELTDTLTWADAFTLEMGREFLIDTITTTAEKIVTATVGQYFVRDEFNLEYHLRIEGGVNYEQKIKDYAATNMSDDVKDSYFFNFLVEYLPIETEQYRREFKIYQHRIEWKSHKTSVDGYIFMGNPDQRDTTHPTQHFYIYFMPMFNAAGRIRDNEPDSVYFHMEDFGEEFKSLLTLYGASESLKAGADTSQKRHYDTFINNYKNQLRTLFATEFKHNTKVYYQDVLQNISPEMLSATTREAAVSNIVSMLLEERFCSERPDYPAFTMLRDPLTQSNKDNILKAARMRIANCGQPSTSGDAILAGLGLMNEGRIDTSSSIYAMSINQKLRDKGDNQVLNQSEILECFYEDKERNTYLWQSRDFQLEPELEFIVLSAMAAVGEIEIAIGSKVINAANIAEIVNLPDSAMISFGNVHRPKGIDIPAVRVLMLGIMGQDLTGYLDDPATYSKLIAESQKLAERAAKASYNIGDGIKFGDVDIISKSEGITIRTILDRIKGIADAVRNFNTKAKLAHLTERIPIETLRETFSHIGEIKRVEDIRRLIKDFRDRLTYLSLARQYVTDPTFEAEIEEAISKSGEVIGSRDDHKIANYRQQLEDLATKYANWYISEYTRCHITQLEENKRQRILGDERLAVLRQIPDTHFRISDKLQPWLNDINSLAPANTPSLEQILATPFHDRFDPRVHSGKKLPDLEELHQRLGEMFEFADEEYHKLLEDPQLKANVSELNRLEKKLFNEFGSKNLITTDYHLLRQVVDKLSQVIERKELSKKAIQEIFTRPLSPSEAKREFAKLIKEIAPTESDNIRIILKD